MTTRRGKIDRPGYGFAPCLNHIIGHYKYSVDEFWQTATECPYCETWGEGPAA